MTDPRQAAAPAVEAMIARLRAEAPAKYDENWQARNQAADILAAQAAEIERLHTRLEDNFMFILRNGEFVREACEPGTIPDGIECRNETIKGIEEQRNVLRAKLAKMTEERDEAREYAKEARLAEKAAEDRRIHDTDALAFERDAAREALAKAVEERDSLLECQLWKADGYYGWRISQLSKRAAAIRARVDELTKLAEQEAKP